MNLKSYFNDWPLQDKVAEMVVEQQSEMGPEATYIVDPSADANDVQLVELGMSVLSELALKFPAAQPALPGSYPASDETSQKRKNDDASKQTSRDMIACHDCHEVCAGLADLRNHLDAHLPGGGRIRPTQLLSDRCTTFAATAEDTTHRCCEQTSKRRLQRSDDAVPLSCCPPSSSTTTTSSDFPDTSADINMQTQQALQSLQHDEVYIERLPHDDDDNNDDKESSHMPSPPPQLSLPESKHAQPVHKKKKEISSKVQLEDHNDPKRSRLQLEDHANGDAEMLQTQDSSVTRRPRHHGRRVRFKDVVADATVSAENTQTRPCLAATDSETAERSAATPAELLQTEAHFESTRRRSTKKSTKRRSSAPLSQGSRVKRAKLSDDGGPSSSSICAADIAPALPNQARTLQVDEMPHEILTVNTWLSYECSLCGAAFGNMLRFDVHMHGYHRRYSQGGNS